MEPTDEPASPWRTLYAGWFAGLTEPTALVTLDPDQKRAAVNAGVLPLDLARDNVLLAYRSPLGAQGLLAIPRERYDPFAVIAALEGTP